MNMHRKQFSTLVGMAALAATLAFCGCGDGKTEGSASFGRPAGFTPMASQGVAFALGANLDKEQAFKIVDAYVDRLLTPILEKTINPEKIREAKDNIAKYKQDLFADAPEDMRDFLEKSGLRKADFRWAALTMEGPLDFSGTKTDLSGLSLAVATDLDVEKTIAAFQKDLAENGDDDLISFKKEAVAGETAWHIVPKEAEDARVWVSEKFRADPYLVSLDGRLVLVALSRETLEKQILLYRKGKGKGDAFEGFSAKTGDFARLQLSGIGDLISKTMSARDLRGISEVLPNGVEIVKRLKNINMDIKAEPDGTTRHSIVLEAASDNDAEKIRTCLTELLSKLKSEIASAANVPQAIMGLTAIKVEGSGSKVELRNIDAIAIVAGTLFPAISSATQNANTSAQAMKGRRLFQGIVMANVDREAMGLPAIWPRTVASEGANADDIADKAYRTAADYFRDLLDLSNYGTDKWAPYIEGADMALLGKDVGKGSTINLSALEWCVAANVTEEMPDYVPVLVSANFNPALLLRKWDGSTDGAKQLPIGLAAGATKTMFGDSAIVVVYKGGSAKVIKKRDLNYNNLYSRQSFDVTNTEQPLVYLTPKGIAEPVGNANF